MASYLPSALPAGEAVTLGSNDLMVVQVSGETSLKRIKWSTLQALQIPTRIGTTCDATKSDYNAAVENGWYILPSKNSGAINGPGTAALPTLGSVTSPYYVNVIASGNYVQQTAYAQQGAGVSDGTALQAYMRVKYNGVWQAWQGIAPTVEEQTINWAGPRTLGPLKYMQGILRQRDSNTGDVVKTWYTMDTVALTFVGGSASYTLVTPYENQIMNVVAVAAGLGGGEFIFVRGVVASTSSVTVLARKVNGDFYEGSLDVVLFMMGH